MKAAERRRAMTAFLMSAKEPVSGGVLSELFGVSRQIVVQDVAALRESGYGILSTNRGYLLQSTSVCERVFKVRHTTTQTEDELNCIIGLGGAVVNVFVWHRVYGRIEAPLNICSGQQIRQFIEGVRSGKSTELMNVTGGYHYHTVRAESEEILDRIAEALESRGYIAQER
jgi:transcriptional regulator of NAD metabolism